MVVTISLQRPLNVGVIKGIVRLAKNDDFSFRVFCKLVHLLVVVTFTGYFIPKTLKWLCNGKKNKDS